MATYRKLLYMLRVNHASGRYGKFIIIIIIIIINYYSLAKLVSFHAFCLPYNVFSLSNDIIIFRTVLIVDLDKWRRFHVDRG